MKTFLLVKQNAIVFPIACLAVLSMVGISETSYRRSVSTLTEVGEVATARTSVLTLAQSMLDAESSQRGYLLTGRDEYLAPFHSALTRIQDSFKFLDGYYRKNPDTLAVMTKLHAVIGAKLSELSETMRLNTEGKREAALQLVLSDIGREKMEAVRELTEDLIARENANVAESRADLFQTLWLSRVGLLLLSALSLLALFMYLRQTSLLVKHREEQQRQALAERDRLEAEVKQRTAQLTELTDHLQTAREDERQRLARNLHDELGALLTSAKLDAARIRPRLAGAAPEALERLNHLVTTLNSSIALGRRIIEDLRPSTLSNLGLLPTLEILARDFSTSSGIKVSCELEPVKLATTAELVVYRLVQEAITNITKYARAGQVWIGMHPHGDRVEVFVRDDGVGFDTRVQPRSAYGLMGMRYRVEAEGGTLRLTSASGQGTEIRISLPQRPAWAPADAQAPGHAGATTAGTPR